MRIFVLILCSLLFSHCETKKDGKAATYDEVGDSVATEASEEQIPEEEGDQEPNYKKLREAFVLSYNDVVKIDTTIAFGAEDINVQLKYYCLFDSAVKIPSKYVWEGGVDQFTTHNFVSDILITKNQDLLYEARIDKDVFANLLSSDLEPYGVLLYPSFRKFDPDKKEFVFHHSISIPITDVGTSATLYVSMDGDARIDKY
jgi:hypothetical protein